MYVLSQLQEVEALYLWDHMEVLEETQRQVLGQPMVLRVLGQLVVVPVIMGLQEQQRRVLLLLIMSIVMLIL